MTGLDLSLLVGAYVLGKWLNIWPSLPGPPPPGTPPLPSPWESTQSGLKAYEQYLQTLPGPAKPTPGPPSAGPVVSPTGQVIQHPTGIQNLYVSQAGIWLAAAGKVGGL